MTENYSGAPCAADPERFDVPERGQSARKSVAT